MKHRPESAGAVERDRALKKIRRLAIKERWPKSHVVLLVTMEQLSVSRFGEFRCCASILRLLSGVHKQYWPELRRALMQRGLMIEVRKQTPGRAGTYRIATTPTICALTASPQTG